MKKPEPINKQVVCSVCGLDWERHGEKRTLEKCVELLKHDLARRPLWNPMSGTTFGWPKQFYGNTPNTTIQ